jgi:hypothetical protein
MAEFQGTALQLPESLRAFVHPVANFCSTDRFVIKHHIYFVRSPITRVASCFGDAIAQANAPASPASVNFHLLGCTNPAPQLLYPTPTHSSKAPNNQQAPAASGQAPLRP